MAQKQKGLAATPRFTSALVGSIPSLACWAAKQNRARLRATFPSSSSCLRAVFKHAFEELLPVIKSSSPDLQQVLSVNPDRRVLGTRRGLFDYRVSIMLRLLKNLQDRSVCSTWPTVLAQLRISAHNATGQRWQAAWMESWMYGAWECCLFFHPDDREGGIKASFPFSL